MIKNDEERKRREKRRKEKQAEGGVDVYLVNLDRHTPSNQLHTKTEAYERCPTER